MNKARKLKELINSYDTVNLSILPTAIHRMSKLSDHLGVNLYCKRDDLSGFAFGGNKTRKLDYLISDAARQGADCIVTFGSNQSNWCRMASAAAAYMGMDIYLLLDESEPEKPSGNLILDLLVGAQIEYINELDPDKIIRLSMQKIEELKKSGRVPYFLPVGGSVPLGSLGYMNAFNEILDFSSATGINFDKIFLATGSAGTQAGLVCAAMIEEWDGLITGVSVGREKQDQEDLVTTLVGDTFNMLGIESDREDIATKVLVEDKYYGEGYRHNTPAAGEAIEMFAQYEGIFLDEVYTGKAAAALIDYARTGKLSENQNNLFIHTGGGIQLFE